MSDHRNLGLVLDRPPIGDKVGEFREGVDRLPVADHAPGTCLEPSASCQQLHIATDYESCLQVVWFHANRYAAGRREALVTRSGLLSISDLTV